ncbi:MAG: sulfur carrier protein ThiS [Prevotellaceae bacterium]|jgi:sulfur carrier protein|nr:sulfur carrier protein ThiS [Prevotellaceae bacterium]
MATITINGETKELAKSLTVAELLVKNDVSQPDMVSVQLNGEFVYKENYKTTEVKDGDEVDFLYFMGGGSF